MTVTFAVVLIGVVVAAGRSDLVEAVATLGHLDWPWLPLAVAAEAASMAAFARTQRRLLRVGGTKLHLGSVMAITYAGNAISVSLPLAGPETATGFVYRSYSRLGIDPAVAGWALAVSGGFSSLAFAMVLAGGALASGSTSGIALGLVGATISLLLTITVLAALRSRGARRRLHWLVAHFVVVSRKLLNRPGPEAAVALDRFLDRVAGLRLPRLQYAEVMVLALWNWVADCLCLAFSIRAIGIAVPWQGLFLAYSAGMAAAGFGLTPGGLGVVEAVLAASLVAVGVKAHAALAAVLVYRLISFWVVMTIGWGVVAILTRARTSPRRRAGHGSD